MPFVARWSGRLPAGKEFRAPVISLDILPTAAALAGARLPSGVRLDGVDLLPHLTGRLGRAPHQRLFWRTGGGAQFAVREGRYKLLKSAEGAQLYDLERDPGETIDISAKRKSVFERLERARQEWNRELKAPLFESPRPAAKKGKKK